MGEILGIGVTISSLILPDAYMSSFLTHTLKSERVPAEMKEPARWPEPLRQSSLPTRTAELRPSTAAASSTAFAGASGARRVQARSGADLGRRPVRKLPQGLRPGVLCLSVRRDRMPSVRPPGRHDQRNVWGETPDTVVRVDGHRPPAATSRQLLKADFESVATRCATGRPGPLLHQHDRLPRSRAARFSTTRCCRSTSTATATGHACAARAHI